MSSVHKTEVEIFMYSAYIEHDICFI